MKDLISFDGDIEEIIKSVTKSENIDEYEIGEISANGKGAGYLGKIFLVTIIDKLSDRRLNILLKLAFKDEKIREVVPILESFKNETYFYSVLYPTLEEFRKSTNCPKEYDLIPKSYHIPLKNQCESLILDNLKYQGFELFDKTSDLTSDHFELIFMYYGYFHAHSFALRDQHFETFSKLISPLNNIYQRFVDSEGFSESLIFAFSSLYENLKLTNNADNILSKLELYTRESPRLYRECIKCDVEYPAITHGDCWSNNMLFKNDEKTGKPIDLRLIDWQIVKAGSPVCDLAYALYTGASKSILDNLDEYLKIYYDSFSSTLEEFGSNPEKIFPFEALKEQWKIYSKFGLLMAPLVLKVKYTNYEDAKDLQDIDFDNIGDVENEKNSIVGDNYDKEKYEKKMYEIISHLYEIDAL